MIADLDLSGIVIIASDLELKPVGATNVVNFTGRTVERIKNSTTGEYENRSRWTLSVAKKPRQSITV